MSKDFLLDDSYDGYLQDLDGKRTAALAVERGGPGSGHFGHAGRPGERGGSLPGDVTSEGERHAPGKEVSVGITSQKDALVSGRQLRSEMEDLRAELQSLPDVTHVRAYMGTGAWQGGGEETFVLRFEGNGEARKALAMAGARWGQDSVLLMEPPIPDNHHVVSELSFDRKLTKAEVSGMNERLASAGFGGWTWGLSRDRYTAMLRVAAVPDYDERADDLHAGRLQSLTTALDTLGLGYQSTQFEAAMTTIGPRGGTDYQAFIDGLTSRALTGYRKRYIKEERGGESGDGHTAGVGRQGEGGLGGRDPGGRSPAGRLAGVIAGVARATDARGRGAGDVRQSGPEQTRVGGALRLLGRVSRLITKGGPGSGHHGHAGRPGERGGSLPGEGGYPSYSPELSKSIVEHTRDLHATWTGEKGLEACVFLDSNGRLTYSKSGDADSIFFTEMEMSEMADSVMIHNHPGVVGSGSGFSVDDLRMAVVTNMAEIRAIGARTGVVYIARRPAGVTWGPKAWDDIAPSYSDGNRETYDRFRREIDEKTLTVAEANLRHQSAVMEYVERSLPRLVDYEEVTLDLALASLLREKRNAQELD